MLDCLGTSRRLKVLSGSRAPIFLKSAERVYRSDCRRSQIVARATSRNLAKRLEFFSVLRENCRNKNNKVVFMAAVYPASAARKIVGVSQRCLDYWDERQVVCPSIKRADGKGSERSYSFDDLLRLTLVKRLREAGLSLQKIRRGLEKLRKRWPANDPLLNYILVTDGQTLFRHTNDDELEDVLAEGQLVFSVIAVGKIRHELRDVILRGSGWGRAPERTRPRKSVNVR